MFLRGHLIPQRQGGAGLIIAVSSAHGYQSWFTVCERNLISEKLIKTSFVFLSNKNICSQLVKVQLKHVSKQMLQKHQKYRL